MQVRTNNKELNLFIERDIDCHHEHPDIDDERRTWDKKGNKINNLQIACIV